jgi:hypothetical protein
MERGRVWLLRLPEVHQELKLDSAQVEQIRQLDGEYEARRREMFRGQRFEDLRMLSHEERVRRFQEMRERGAKLDAEQGQRLSAILDGRQLARLRELQIQQMGARALATKDVRDALRLTADQRERIDGVLQAEGDQMRATFMGGFPGGGPPTPEQVQAARTKMAELWAATDARLLGILTDSQKKQFEQMKGAPFKFPERKHIRGPRPNAA